MNLYTVRFWRVGHHEFPEGRDHVFNAADAQDLARQVWRAIGPRPKPRRGPATFIPGAVRLASSQFEVTIEGAAGLIEGGRFGRFDVIDHGEFRQ